jgi:hypothetical protein
MSSVVQRILPKQGSSHHPADPVGPNDNVGDHRVGTVEKHPAAGTISSIAYSVRRIP